MFCDMSKSIFVNECSKRYASVFAIDWIEEYSWDEPLNCEQSYKQGISKISDFVEYCFIEISKSIISGEYVIKTEIDNDLTTFSELLSNEYPPYEENAYKNKLYEEYRRLDNNIIVLIKHYRYFISVVNDKINLTHPDLIVNAFYTERKRTTHSLLDNLYKYVFPICQLDHMLSYDEYDVQNLILLCEDLLKIIPKQKSEIKPIFEVLKDKCQLLMKKLVFKDQITEYSVDFLKKKINLGEVNSEAFKGFDTSFNFFQQDSYSEFDRNVVEWQKKCREKNLKVGQMLLLMKFYKDYRNSSIIQIDNLLKEFNGVYEMLCLKFANRQFDIYALSTLKNYMYNCRLSFHLKDSKYTFEQLCEDITELEIIQTETQVRNFYPFRKAIIWLFEVIRNEMQENKMDHNSLDTRVHFLEKCICRFEEAIKWCEKNHFYPVQNMYNECIARTNYYDGVVFTPSSYSRPIKYERLRDSLQEYKEEIRFLKNEIIMHDERQEVEHLKETIDSSKKSNIEILGAFTAVITFLFGCVNIFSVDNNATMSFKEQVGHIVCLGLILLLFVNAIYFLTLRKEAAFKEYLKHPRFYAFGLSAIFYVALLAFLLLQLW